MDTENRYIANFNSYDIIERAAHAGVEVPEEMLDFVNVMLQSAQVGKYPANNWLDKDGLSSDVKSMHASLNRHVAEAYCGRKKDKQSGLHPLLHAACRCLMWYVRDVRGLNKKVGRLVLNPEGWLCPHVVHKDE